MNMQASSISHPLDGIAGSVVAKQIGALCCAARGDDGIAEEDEEVVSPPLGDAAGSREAHQFITEPSLYEAQEAHGAYSGMAAEGEGCATGATAFPAITDETSTELLHHSASLSVGEVGLAVEPEDGPKAGRELK